ncbi:helix-turn-helix domain-containing protein [Agarivorans sp. QJM3NY_25]|uniref:helix-turn-helix domain-containing protein n=1 Tax=Agarivorans sp. QJM3NY_25 TaxID=3421430 RepID=UPI003D7CD386
MTSEEIKNELYQKGYTLRLLADASGLCRTGFTNVINRRDKSRNVAGVIAKALERPIAEVFPDMPEYTDGYARPARGNARDAKLEELQQRLAS